MKAEVALVCLTALGVVALVMGRDEGIYATVINGVASVVLVAQRKKEAT